MADKETEPQAQNPTNPTREPHPKVEAWQRRFLKELAYSGNVMRAAAAAGRNRQYVYERRETDPVFADAWDAAVEDSGDVLEGEGFRRGVEGVEKPVYQGGELVGKVREYSDALLILLIKHHTAKAEKYRERKDVTSGGETLAVQLYLPKNGSEGPAGDEDHPPAGG